MAEQNKSLIHPQTSNYGKIVVTLKDYLDQNNIPRFNLAKRANISYNALNRLYKNESIERVDTDLLARICYILDCELSDLITYQKPE